MGFITVEAYKNAHTMHIQVHTPTVVGKELF